MTKLSDNQKQNIIFLGGFPYPQGMAGTKRIQHAIDGLKEFPDVAIRVIILTQSSHENSLNGSHRGIPYQTIMGDLRRIKAAFYLPLLSLKACRVIKWAFRENCNNVIYNYGPPGLFNIGVLLYAHRLGYKIIFDIVEDDDTAMSISSSLYHKIKLLIIKYLTKRIKRLANGIVVISSHLHNKYEALSAGKVQLHYRPISVDFSHYPSTPGGLGDPVTLFYAGSFGKKDGLPVLLDAFDCLAERNADIRLVLTGKGSEEMMQSTLARVAASPFKDRIEYKGYLDDTDYYAALNAADILCMTRIDLAYAHAGFPFKLGEFLATGKPVIASRVSDVESFLAHKSDAMLVKPSNSAEIVAAVEYLLTHPQEALAIGERGRKTAKEHFDYQIQGRALLTFIQGL
jgi:glycosyltransferase involved in cell wall biosynthesis